MNVSLLRSRARVRGLLIALGAAVMLAGCWGEEAGVERMSGGGLVEARSGSALAGFVNIKRRHGTLKLFLNVLNAPPGEHAVRLHQLPDCGASDASSAGGLWSPGVSPLGEGVAALVRTSARAELADLGNLLVDETGKGQLAFSTGGFSFGDGSELDLVGRTLVIHSKSADALALNDGSDQRIGCGVIR